VARGRRFGQHTRQTQVAQDLLDHGAVLNGRNQTEATAAAGAGQDLDHGALKRTENRKPETGDRKPVI
jgi:hypothetical protein